MDTDDHPPAHQRPVAVHVPLALRAAGAYSWRLLAIAGAMWVVAWCLTQLYVVVVPLILALFLAAAVHPLVEHLRRWLPSGVATALVFVVLLGLLAAAVLWLSGQVRGQFDDLGEQAREGIDQVERWLTTGPLDLDPQRVGRLEQQLTSVQLTGGGLTERILGRARQLVEVVGGVTLMVFAAFFLVKDGHRIGPWLLERVDEAYRDDARAAAVQARTVMRWYLVGTAAVGVADASLLAVALVVLGVPLVLPLTLLTFAAAFFPIVGAVVAGAVAALVALVAGGFQTALLVVLATITVQQVEGNLLQPVIMGRAVNLHPLVTLSVVSAGLISAGLVGAFLAVPLTAIAVRLSGWYRRRSMDPDTDEADPQQLDLARRQGDAYGAAVQHMAEQVAQAGGQQRAGDYIVGFAVEAAEGMYAFDAGTLSWHEPGGEDVHVEVVVRDAGDGRFVPDCDVTVTLVDADGVEVGTHEQPMFWHPVQHYHYGRNWTVPGDGTYAVRVHISPPRFMRHDETNGRRFTEDVTVEFTDVEVTTSQHQRSS